MVDCITLAFMGAELFHAEGQTDLAKLVHFFRNIANASKMDEATVVASRTERKQDGTV